jgi:hypothetical protein
MFQNECGRERGVRFGQNNPQAASTLECEAADLRPPRTFWTNLTPPRLGFREKIHPGSAS